MATLIACGLLLATADCGFRRGCIRPDPVPSPGADEVIVTYLGSGGFLIRRGSDAILTAPLYSNPTIGELAFQDFHPDTRMIDAYLPDVEDVRAILVGHAHYDHLMDVPYVAGAKAPQALVYGNDTMVHILDALPDKARRISVEAEAKSGRPVAVPNARVRVWPLLSEHSSQFAFPKPLGLVLAPVHLWRGQALQPAPYAPTRAGQFPEGTTLAYLIDFLEPATDAVAFRVYYQDSGTRPPWGHPPPALLAERRVDLALLCAGGSETLDEHPTAIARALRPDFAIAAHWEDFLNPRPQPMPTGLPSQETVKAIPGSKPGRFLKKLRAALPPSSRYALLCPDAVTRLCRRGDRWEMDSPSPYWHPGTGP